MRTLKHLLMAGSAIGLALVMTESAVAAAMPSLAQPGAEEWMIGGSTEFGGQVFLTKPGAPVVTPTWNGSQIISVPALGNSAAGYNQYGNQTDPLFMRSLEANFAKKDGSMNVELLGANIGEDNQKLELDAASPGQWGLELSWDKTDHLRSNTAQSPFGGVGTSNLTVPGSLITALQGDYTGTAAGYVKEGADILAAEHVINIGIQRDRKEGGFTWDLGPQFSVKVDYSNEHRYGVQEQGMLFSSNPSGNAAQVPMPVDDTTQDASIAAQYFGKTPWGGKWNGILKYDASIYTDAVSANGVADSFMAANPFGGKNTTGTTCFGRGAGACNTEGAMGTAPSNQANTVMAQAGVDLPGFKSNRYMGTLQFSRMTQNDAFMPMMVSGYTPVGSGSLPSYDTTYRSSLNGQIDTFLSNNVLSTQFTSDLKNKLTYRYYSLENGTAPLNIQTWILNDSATSASYNNHSALFQSYVKQNASDELTYRLGSLGSVGVFGGWEGYKYTEFAADQTNEWTGKVFGQFTPTDAITVRFDDLYAQRRYNIYNWDTLITSVYGPGASNLEKPFMVDVDLANRNRSKGYLYIDYTTPFGVTLTPTAGYRWDDYPRDPNILTQGDAYQGLATVPAGSVGQLGVLSDHSYNLGLDANWVINSSVSLNLGYTFEHSAQDLWGSTASTTNNTTTKSATADIQAYDSLMTEDVHTLMAGAKFNLIPDRLTLKLSGTYEFAADNWATSPLGGCLTTGGGSNKSCGVVNNGTTITNANPVAYPTEFVHYSHIDADLMFKFDPIMFGSTKMDAVLSLKYRYEQNAVTNWQTDGAAAYMYSNAPTSVNSASTLYNMIFMAGDNPNYSAQVVMATLALKW